VNSDKDLIITELTLEDIRLALKLIEAAAERNTFKLIEYAAVGYVVTKFEKILNTVEKTNDNE
jgi:hypothetical protein